MANTEFIRTDLASEAKEAANIENIRGISYRETELHGVSVSDMKISSEEGSSIIGKPVGRYITVECKKSWLLSDEEKENVISALTDFITELIPKGEKTVLVVGLGNRDITPDSLGPRTVDSLIVTRHVKEFDRKLFDSIGQEEVAAVAPGVVGQTGIETLELIRGAVERVKPDVVIAVDALAARSVDRLGSTLQLSDTGISPGSGIGNRRREINRTSIGVPVIAIGVPTVVDSSTLVYDALSKAGIEDIDDPLKKVLENGRSFFVSLKESDVAVAESASLISSALNRAFCRG
ncbi:MAG: GPR endopeptidase [Clostridia bacterium]|nr:GPR endopeptidase [Clostridia bacterium]MBQ4601497.1 GPR endopeptidase [Clostridia bacterium]